MGFSSVLISKIFNNTSYVWSIIISCLIVSNPAFAFSHLYVSSIFIYALALLFSVLCVWFISKPRQKKNFILAVISLIFSLCCYQAYIGMTVCLMLVLLLIKLQTEKETNKYYLKQILYFIGCLLVSIIVYYGVWKSLMFITNANTITGYREYGTTESYIFSNIFVNIYSAFIISLSKIFTNWYDMSNFAYVISVILTIIGFIITIVNVLKNKVTKFQKFLTLLILCFAIPVGMSFIYLLSNGSVHMLMSYTFIIPILITIISVVIANRNTKTRNKKIFATEMIVSILSTILSFSLIVSANTLYLQAKTQYDTSLSYCTRLLDRIEQFDGYNKDIKVAFVSGKKTYNEENAWSRNDFYIAENDTIGDATAVERFLKYELNCRLEMCAENIGSDNKKYYNLDAVKKLDTFPEKNCMVWVDDTLVVKVYSLNY